MNKKGFTLVEIMVVAAILGSLAAGAALVNFVRTRQTAQEAVCAHSRRMIEQAEAQYFAERGTHSANFQDLVDQGYLRYLTACPAGGVYAWMPGEPAGSDDQALVGCSIHGAGEAPQGPYVITTADGVSVPGLYGRLEGSYTGSATDIMIPKSVNGFDVKYIWQDVFNGKGLTSLAFEENSALERIHARAFRNNNLTTIDLPDGLKRIDLYAFSGNKLREVALPASLEHIEMRAFSGNSITKITIGSGVTIDDRAFETNAFRDAYYAGGQGTYVLADGVWKKS